MCVEKFVGFRSRTSSFDYPLQHCLPQSQRGYDVRARPQGNQLRLPFFCWSGACGHAWSTMPPCSVPSKKELFPVFQVARLTRAETSHPSPQSTINESRFGETVFREPDSTPDRHVVTHPLTHFRLVRRTVREPSQCPPANASASSCCTSMKAANTAGSGPRSKQGKRTVTATPVLDDWRVWQSSQALHL